MAALKNCILAFICMGINKLPGFFAYDNRLLRTIEPDFIATVSVLRRLL